MQSLEFEAGGATLAATLEVPEGNTKRGPAIVVLGSWLTVKEQMAANHAREMAAAGFTALTFDFRGYGASEGEPREVESGRAKAQDILDAIAYLGTRPEVDPARIGVLAICASAHYTALALQGASTFGRPPVRGVTMVAPWMHDAALVETLHGGRDAVNARLDRAAAARARYVATGEIEYVPAASNTDKDAAMYMEGDALDYYLNPKRGAIAAWGGRFATMAWTEWLTMDSAALAPRFDVPLRIITGEKTATPEGVKRFVARLGGAHDVVSGPPEATSQFDYYDDPATVRFCSEKAAEHFHEVLR